LARGASLPGSAQRLLVQPAHGSAGEGAQWSLHEKAAHSGGFFTYFPGTSVSRWLP
jgi:hypothetical protein